jgi:hypothetical protein
MALARANPGFDHRDLSVTNCMLTDIEGKLRGILADWDHARATVLAEGSTRQKFRSVRSFLIFGNCSNFLAGYVAIYVHCHAERHHEVS